MAEQQSNGRITAGDAIRSARALVEEMTAKPTESVSGIARCESGGWEVSIDVVELSRVPPSTDLLSTYEVVLDPEGDLVDMTRARRFVRGQADEE